MNVTDFRNNLRDCFDKAVAGEEVEIERGGVLFRLRAEGTIYKVNTDDVSTTFDPGTFTTSNIRKEDNE